MATAKKQHPQDTSAPDTPENPATNPPESLPEGVSAGDPTQTPIAPLTVQETTPGDGNDHVEITHMSDPTPATPPIHLSDLSSLTPEQLAKLRSMVTASGLLRDLSPEKDSDGSVWVRIRVPIDCVEQINSWREESGRSFEEEVQYWCEYLLSSYMGGQWVSEAPVATVVTPTPSAT